MIVRLLFAVLAVGVVVGSSAVASQRAAHVQPHVAISPPGAASPRQDSTVTFLGYRTTVPRAWRARPAESRMRLAQYVVAGTDTTNGAEVVVYFFGKGQGGSVEANLARWKAQFSEPDGSPVPERITRDSSGSFPITFAEYRGTYARGIGAGAAPPDARPDQALIAGIAETPRGTLFIQLFGPAADVAVQRSAFLGFVRGLHEPGAGAS